MKNKIHKLKIEQKYLDDLLYGNKKFEIRYNDRGYQVGDFLEFENEKGKFVFAVEYVHSGLGLQDGYVCMTVRYMSYASEVGGSK